MPAVTTEAVDDLRRLHSERLDALQRELWPKADNGDVAATAACTQAGKTTFLNCLSSAIPSRERVVTCEEVFELKIPLRDVASMQCRQPSLEGTGEVPLRRLVKEALRMRPSRIMG